MGLRYIILNKFPFSPIPSINAPVWWLKTSVRTKIIASYAQRVLCLLTCSYFYFFLSRNRRLNGKHCAANFPRKCAERIFIRTYPNIKCFYTLNPNDNNIRFRNIQYIYSFNWFISLYESWWFYGNNVTKKIPRPRQMLRHRSHHTYTQRYGFIIELSFQ